MLTHSELTLVNHYVSTLPTLTAYCMQNHEEEEKSFQSHIFATRCTLCKREPDPGSGLVPRHAREIARALVIGPTQEPCVFASTMNSLVALVSMHVAMSELISFLGLH